ncbi:MAG: 3D domain-containing protein [Actinobacteria bacterium]|nr:3D domain-containing protein [Actinomycetota bacterium]
MKSIKGILFAVILLSSFFVPFKYTAAETFTELNEKILGLSTQQEQLLRDLVGLETTIDRNIQQLKLLQEKSVKAKDDYKNYEKVVAAMRGELDHKFEVLNDRAVSIYKHGQASELMILFSSENVNELLSNAEFFQILMEQDAELVTALKEQKAAYEKANKNLRALKEELERSLAEVEQKQERLDKEYAEKKELLATIKIEKADLIEQAKAIRDRMTQIQKESNLILVDELDMVATAYYAGGGGINGDGITATGLRATYGIAAVDPKVIPLGTKLFIPGYGPALAADTGGWIKGNRIDLVFNSLEESYRWGRRSVKVYIVE